ncbi:MAG TPA: flippase activity-associated protein Agl23, partial [Pyrinomonadaceae bacterium]|nr:flippase activity-associated protein Agl23 [Pyrinomonadaceae bacterium]
MSTDSTKQPRKKGQPAAGRPAKPEPAAEETRPRLGDEVPERVWRWASISILMLATALRFYALDLKPLHHDEGVNGFFLTNLLNGFGYRYDPQNYHGPSLYFLTAPLAKLAGLTTYAVRIPVALFGVGTVWLVLALRRHLGAVAALAAAALVAASPGAVYYSRYFIHETPFVFFTLAIVVAALRFHETGRGGQLMLFALSAALLFTTKETAFISAGTLVLAALVAWSWVQLTGGPAAAAVARAGRRRKGGETGLGAAFARLGGNAPLYVGGAALLFVAVYVLLYTSFFTNSKGFSDSFAAFNVWSKTGASDFHAKPFYTYVKWLYQEEGPILILATAGAAVALFERSKNRFAIFAGAWAFGLLLAYSLIKYKTPWLVLSFVVPLCLAAGYAVQALGRLSWLRLSIVLAAAAIGLCLMQDFVSRAALALVFTALDDASAPLTSLVKGVGLASILTAVGLAALWVRGRGEPVAWSPRTPALALAGLAVFVCLWQSAVLNFVRYDDDRYPYVYSHTQREALELVRQVELLRDRLRERTRADRPPRVTISTSEYWPLPWYFQGIPGVAYEQRVNPSYDPLTVDAVIGRESDNP